MTDIEFAKEIAEKVWGWKTKMIDAGFISTKVEHEWWINKKGKVVFHFDKINRYVNSWQGFGRTVEAMDERGFQISFHSDTALDNRWRAEFVFIDESGLATLEGHCEDKCIFKATHQAALDAVKKNNK